MKNKRHNDRLLLRNTHTRTQRTPASQAVSGDQSSQEASQWQSTTTLLYCMLDLDEEAVATSCLWSPNTCRRGRQLLACGLWRRATWTEYNFRIGVPYSSTHTSETEVTSIPIINRARGPFFKTFYMYLDVEFFKQKASRFSYKLRLFHYTG